MKYKDYYADLGVTRAASPAEIKKAYRALAKKHHPDKSTEAGRGEDRFKEINEANEVLSDPVKRQKYDQFGIDWKRFEEAGSQPGGFDWSKYAAGGGDRSHSTGPDPSSTGFGDGGVDDLFELLFGQQSGERRRWQSSAFRGEDLETETILSLEEAYHGSTRLITLNDQTIKVTIRPGIADQQVLRIAGKGGSGMNGGPGGDLFLKVRIARDPSFRREGNDLHAVLPVALYDAVLGGKTKIHTMKGSVAVTLPRGTLNGKVLRLRGVGMPVYGKKGRFGDLMATVDVVLPTQLNELELGLFGQLAAQRR
jgi:curved DNA-binding protein